MLRIRKMRKLGWGLVVGTALLWTSSASALSLVVTGPPVMMTTDGPTTFSISFDAQTSFNGYDLFFTWDMTELTFAGATNLFPDSLPPDFFTFTVLNTGLGSGMIGIGRASSLTLSALTTTGLMELLFTPTGTADSPGSPLPGASLILSQSAAGLTGGFAPAGLTVTNPDPYFTSVVVPEPGTGLLLLGLAALAWRSRRR